MKKKLLDGKVYTFDAMHIRECFILCISFMCYMYNI